MSEVFESIGGGLVARIDTRKVGRTMRRYPAEYAAEARRAFIRAGARWERDVKDSFQPYKKGRSPRGGIQSRSGQLRRTIRYKAGPATSNPGSVSVLLIAGDARTPYARTQEFGAEIEPVRGQYLTVPLDDALTPAGVVSGKALLRRIGNRYFTDYGPTFIYESAAGNKIIAVKHGGGILNLYVLKRSVTIPGPETTGDPSSLGARREAKAVVSKHLARELNEAADKVWKRRK